MRLYALRPRLDPLLQPVIAQAIETVNLPKRIVKEPRRVSKGSDWHAGRMNRCSRVVLMLDAAWGHGSATGACVH